MQLIVYLRGWGSEAFYVIGVAVRKEKTRTVSSEANKRTGNLFILAPNVHRLRLSRWALPSPARFLRPPKYCSLPALCQYNIAGLLPTYRAARGFMQDRHDKG